MRLAIFFVLSLLAATPAMAQSNLAPLLQQIQSDAKAALADANSHEDKIASTCYEAILADVTVKLQTAQVSGGGLLTAFQKVRDLNRLSSSPQGTSLIVGCAALVQDARLNMLSFFTKIGGAVLLKGLLIP